MKKISWSSLILFIALAACTTTGGTDNSARNEQSASWGSSYGGADKSYDTELLRLRELIAPRFQTLEFHDPVTGKSMTYNLYVPQGYDRHKSYPLVLFMADASTTGKGAAAPLMQGYGGIIWATDASQAEHPCFVLVPAFAGPENVTNDDWEVTDEADMVVRLLDHVVSGYSIDTDRLYTTGQSMGGMISFYLNANHPDLFAASIFVGSQWDVNILEPLANMKFFYIVSEADPKASVGMRELGGMLANLGVAYGDAQFDASPTGPEREQDVLGLLTEGHAINFIRFTKDTVAPASVREGERFSEHMYSFDHAYKLKSVRDWLFRQSKGASASQGGSEGLAAYDVGRAFPAFLRAALWGDAQAQYRVGRAYEKGEGVAQDYAKAARWYRKAMAQGVDSAMLDLGIMYFNGEGVARDYGQAAEFFNLAWSSGHMKAPRYLGIMSEEGLGGPVDYTVALAFYKAASGAGDITAAARIGWLYERGLGVERSYAEALKWYLAAAPSPEEAAGNVHPRVLALVRLGFFYEHGLGVERDAAHAIAWYRVAAIDGDEQAVAALERLGAQ